MEYFKKEQYINMIINICYSKEQKMDLAIE
jgi:hypothetical protein